jgi:uncharacterized protein (DUF952 family)
MPRSPVLEGPLLHVIPRARWEALGDASHWRPPSLAEHGFVHLCRPEQLAGVLDRWFAGRDDLAVLELDARLLEAPIDWAELPHGCFPHLLGPLNLSAVISVRDRP